MFDTKVFEREWIQSNDEIKAVVTNLEKTSLNFKNKIGKRMNNKISFFLAKRKKSRK